MEITGKSFRFAYFSAYCPSKEGVAICMISGLKEANLFSIFFFAITGKAN